MNLSERIYRLLLKLYPREHRRHYGQLMVTHFRDQMRDAGSNRALLILWLRTLLDVAKTAPLEHAEAARLRDVTPWSEVLLAILPALVMILLPPQPVRIERLSLLGIGVIYLLFLVLYLWRKRSAAWSLPMLGLAATFAMGWGIFLLQGTRSWLAESAPVVVLLAAVVVVLHQIRLHSRRSSAVLFALLLLLSLGALLAQDNPFALVAAAALQAPALLILAIALGLPFARRYGLLGALFVAGSAHWAVELTIDPSLQIRFGPWPQLLSLLGLATTLIVIPLLALRAQSDRRRFLAIFLPLAVYLLLLVVLPPLVYTISPYTAGRADLANLLRQALYNTLYAAQILACTALALTLYSTGKTDGAPARPPEFSLSGETSRAT